MSGQNARVYWEMFGGTNPTGRTDLYVRYCDIDMDIGGYYAYHYPDYFQVSVYGREYLDGPNLETLYQAPITTSITDIWTPVTVRATLTSTEVRCIVVKLERTDEPFVTPTLEVLFFGDVDDQYDTSRPPPWGVRIHSASIYGTSVGRNVRPEKVLEHIVELTDLPSLPAFTFSGPTTTWVADQLCFRDIPKDRHDAIDEVNGLVGWNYHCWNGTTVVFSLPKAGTAWEVAADDPRTEWDITQSLDETYNACRVCYGNKRGKTREVIVHGDQGDIGIMRADTLQAPESIKTEAAAIRFGERFLRDHEDLQVSGTLRISGDDGTLDALLIRPGDTITMTGEARPLTGTYEVTQVTLHPLDWSADVQFGWNSKRFDVWLARLATGGKNIKRR